MHFVRAASSLRAHTPSGARGCTPISASAGGPSGARWIWRKRPAMSRAPAAAAPSEAATQTPPVVAPAPRQNSPAIDSAVDLGALAGLGQLPALDTGFIGHVRGQLPMFWPLAFGFSRLITQTAKASK